MGRGGAYQHYEFIQNDVKISITLLDNRFFRTPYLGEKIAGQISNTQGVLLGDQQWRWLENVSFTLGRSLRSRTSGTEAPFFKACSPPTTIVKILR